MQFEKKIIVMSTATLNNLLEYLYGTLTPDNMRWVGRHLIEHADKEDSSLKPYTIEELHARIDKAEREIAAGLGTSHEEVMRRCREKIALKKQEIEMAETI